MATKLTGVAIVKVNGQYFRSTHDSTMMVGGFNREPQAADGKAYVGYTEEPVAATVEAKFRHGADVDLVGFANFRDISLDFETDSGQIYRVGDAQISEPPTLTGATGGEFSVSFFGKAAKKVV